MRAIAAILLLIFVAGCSKSGPTAEEANVTYESEAKKLESLEIKLKEAEVASKKSEELSRQAKESQELLLSSNPGEEAASQINEIKTRSEENQTEMQRLNAEEIALLKGMRDAQKQRVEAARKLKDAAK